MFIELWYIQKPLNQEVMKNLFYLFLTVLITTVIFLIGSDLYEPELIYSTVILVWILYLWQKSYANKRNYSE